MNLLKKVIKSMLEILLILYKKKNLGHISFNLLVTCLIHKKRQQSFPFNILE